MTPLITLTTDFGTADPWVGIMKGVIATIAPETRVVDVTHGIPAQDVRAGALVLRHALPYFPKGSIHVAVVDPGVGGPRRPLCVVTAAGVLVGPDNGVLWLAAEAAGAGRVIHITDERLFLTPRSHTFHGRDVFAPVAAALATGTPPDVLGPEVTDPHRLDLPAPQVTPDAIRGAVVYVDRFGNLTTNVAQDLLATFPRNGLSISIRGTRMSGVAPSYAAVAPGQPVAVVNSWGLLEIAVRDGSARTTLRAEVGDEVVCTRN